MAEIARLETTAADHSADFERERERADRLAVELLQSTAEMLAAKEMTARLEDEVAALRSGGQNGAQPTPMDKLHADWDTWPQASCRQIARPTGRKIMPSFLSEHRRQT